MAQSATQPSSVALRRFARGIRSVNKLPPYVKTLAYGDNGSGKTRFAASAPGVLIVDIREKGTRSAAGSKAHVREVSTFDEIGLAYWYLKAGNHPFKSVALDTITALHLAALDKVMKEKEERDPTREKKLATIKEHYKAGKLTEGMLTMFRNLPMHVVFLAQERKEKDEDGNVENIYPDMPDKAGATAAALTGIIGHMERRRVKGKWTDTMLVGDSKMYKTKDRTYLLGSRVIQPTMPDMIRAWNTRRSHADD